MIQKRKEKWGVSQPQTLRMMIEGDVKGFSADDDCIKRQGCGVTDKETTLRRFDGGVELVFMWRV
jgi:hypothetical protein